MEIHQAFGKRSLRRTEISIDREYGSKAECWDIMKTVFESLQIFFWLNEKTYRILEAVLKGSLRAADCLQNILQIESNLEPKCFPSSCFTAFTIFSSKCRLLHFSRSVQALRKLENCLCAFVYLGGTFHSHSLWPLRKKKRGAAFHFSSFLKNKICTFIWTALSTKEGRFISYLEF